MAVEVRDVALEHYSASAVLVRFPSGDKVWLPLSQSKSDLEARALPAFVTDIVGSSIIIIELFVFL